MNAIRTHFPGLWALIDPVEREAALLDALGKYGEAAEMRAQAELKIDWTVDPAIAELEKITEEALNQTFGLKIDLKTALESGLLDFSTAMEDIASDARAVFDDRFVEVSEVNDIASRLREARWSDPEKFAEMGGDAALAFFGPLETMLNDLEWTLQDIAVYEAQGLVVPIELRDRRDELIARLKDTLTSEEFEIFIKGNVVIDRSAFGGVKAESLVTQLSVGDLMGKVLGGEQLSAYIGRPDVWKEEVLLPARFEELKQWKEYYDAGWLKPEANVAFANSILELRDAQACLFLTIEDAPIQEYKAISEEHRTGADAVKMLSEIYKGLDGVMNKNKDTTKDYGDELDKLTHELSTACECASDWAKWQEDPANNMFAKSVVTNTQSYVDRIKELAAEGLATETQIRYAAEQELEQNRIDELAEDLLGVGRTTIQTFLECDTSAAEESIESMSTMAEETRTMPLNVDSTGPLEAIRVIDAAAAQPITKLIYLQCVGCVGALGGGQMGGSITFTSGGGLGAVENQYPGITESPGWGTPSWLPVLDSGGLVSGPTLAMLAANAKPEVVAPLDSLFTIIREAVGNKSGGNTFNIVVHEAVNAEETAEIVAKKIAESEERIAVAYRNRTKGATYRSSQTTYFGTAGL